MKAEESINSWELRYRQGDTGWDRGAASPALQSWLDSGVLTPCRLLIPGCGRGHEVVQLARLGFDVTAIDIAPSALAYLQQQLDAAAVSATLICGDLFEYQPDTGFDALYEQTCLCAIQPEQRTAYASAVHSWLKPSGKLFALFMQTGQAGGPPFHCELPEMRKLFDSEHWLWPDTASARVERNSGKYELGYVLIRQ